MFYFHKKDSIIYSERYLLYSQYQELRQKIRLEKDDKKKKKLLELQGKKVVEIRKWTKNHRYE